eukprot:gene1792-1087_t
MLGCAASPATISAGGENAALLELRERVRDLERQLDQERRATTENLMRDHRQMLLLLLQSRAGQRRRGRGASPSSDWLTTMMMVPPQQPQTSHSGTPVPPLPPAAAAPADQPPPPPPPPPPASDATTATSRATTVAPTPTAAQQQQQQQQPPPPPPPPPAPAPVASSGEQQAPPPVSTVPAVSPPPPPQQPQPTLAVPSVPTPVGVAPAPPAPAPPPPAPPPPAGAPAPPAPAPPPPAPAPPPPAPAPPPAGAPAPPVPAGATEAAAPPPPPPAPVVPTTTTAAPTGGLPGLPGLLPPTTTTAHPAAVPPPPAPAPPPPPPPSNPTLQLPQNIAAIPVVPDVAALSAASLPQLEHRQQAYNSELDHLKKELEDAAGHGAAAAGIPIAKPSRTTCSHPTSASAGAEGVPPPPPPTAPSPSPAPGTCGARLDRPCCHCQPTSPSPSARSAVSPAPPDPVKEAANMIKYGPPGPALIPPRRSPSPQQKQQLVANYAMPPPPPPPGAASIPAWLASNGSSSNSTVPPSRSVSQQQTQASSAPHHASGHQHHSTSKNTNSGTLPPPPAPAGPPAVFAPSPAVMAPTPAAAPAPAIAAGGIPVPVVAQWGPPAPKPTTAPTLSPAVPKPVAAPAPALPVAQPMTAYPPRPPPAAATAVAVSSPIPVPRPGAAPAAVPTVPGAAPAVRQTAVKFNPNASSGSSSSYSYSYSYGDEEEDADADALIFRALVVVSALSVSHALTTPLDSNKSEIEPIRSVFKLDWFLLCLNLYYYLFIYLLLLLFAHLSRCATRIEDTHPLYCTSRTSLSPFLSHQQKYTILQFGGYYLNKKGSVENSIAGVAGTLSRATRSLTMTTSKKKKILGWTLPFPSLCCHYRCLSASSQQYSLYLLLGVFVVVSGSKGNPVHRITDFIIKARHLFAILSFIVASDASDAEAGGPVRRRPPAPAPASPRCAYRSALVGVPPYHDSLTQLLLECRLGQLTPKNFRQLLRQEGYSRSAPANSSAAMVNHLHHGVIHALPVTTPAVLHHKAQYQSRFDVGVSSPALQRLEYLLRVPHRRPPHTLPRGEEPLSVNVKTVEMKSPIALRLCERGGGYYKHKEEEEEEEEEEAYGVHRRVFAAFLLLLLPAFGMPIVGTADVVPVTTELLPAQLVVHAEDLSRFFFTIEREAGKGEKHVAFDRVQKKHLAFQADVLCPNWGSDIRVSLAVEESHRPASSSPRSPAQPSPPPPWPSTPVSIFSHTQRSRSFLGRYLFVDISVVQALPVRSLFQRRREQQQQQGGAGRSGESTSHEGKAIEEEEEEAGGGGSWGAGSPSAAARDASASAASRVVDAMLHTLGALYRGAATTSGCGRRPLASLRDDLTVALLHTQRRLRKVELEVNIPLLYSDWKRIRPSARASGSTQTTRSFQEEEDVRASSDDTTGATSLGSSSALPPQGVAEPITASVYRSYVHAAISAPRGVADAPSYPALFEMDIHTPFQTVERSGSARNPQERRKEDQQQQKTQQEEEKEEEEEDRAEQSRHALLYGVAQEMLAVLQFLAAGREPPPA